MRGIHSKTLLSLCATVLVQGKTLTCPEITPLFSEPFLREREIEKETAPCFLVGFQVIQEITTNLLNDEDGCRTNTDTRTHGLVTLTYEGGIQEISTGGDIRPCDHRSRINMSHVSHVVNVRSQWDAARTLFNREYARLIRLEPPMLGEHKGKCNKPCQEPRHDLLQLLDIFFHAAYSKKKEATGHCTELTTRLVADLRTEWSLDHYNVYAVSLKYPLLNQDDHMVAILTPPEVQITQGQPFFDIENAIMIDPFQQPVRDGEIFPFMIDAMSERTTLQEGLENLLLMLNQQKLLPPSYNQGLRRVYNTRVDSILRVASRSSLQQTYDNCLCFNKEELSKFLKRATDASKKSKPFLDFLKEEQHTLAVPKSPSFHP